MTRGAEIQRARAVDAARAALGLAALCLLLAAVLAPAPAAAAVGEDYVFNAVLSLEGDCEAQDGVADPDCPYPPPPPEGEGPRPISRPCGVDTDPHGDVYLAVPGTEAEADRVDVFDPAGRFLTEFPAPEEPCSVAVDSVGNVYVEERAQLEVEGDRVRYLNRFAPDSYPPGPAAEYTLAATREFMVQEAGKVADFCASPGSLAVDPSNDHLYVAKNCRIEEYGSAAEGSQPDGIDEVQRLTVDASAGSFKLAFFPSSAVDFTADLSAGSHAFTSVLGAAGAGTLTAGSTAVTSLTTTSGTFKVGRPVSGPGIPEGTGTGDLSAASGEGTLTSGSKEVTGVLAVTGAFAVGQEVSGTGIPRGTGTGTLASGSKEVTSVTGSFVVGEAIFGAGIPVGATIAKVGAGTLELSAAATASGAQALTAVTTIAKVGAGTLELSAAATASGAQALTAGSRVIRAVSTATGAFAVGQTVFAAGVPAGTTITAVGAGTLTLSKTATENRASAALRANTTIEEATRGSASGFLRLSLPASASGTAIGLTSKGIDKPGPLRAFGPGVPPGAEIFSASPGELSRGTGVLIGTTGKGDLSAGSSTVANLSTTSGAFAVGQTVFAAGVPAGTTITAVGAGTLTLSSAATETRAGATLRASTNATASGAAVPLAAGEEPEETIAIPYDATATTTVQAALEALPGIGAGNVSVSGGPGGPGAASPYLIAFQGELANTDVPQLGAESAGLTGGPAAATLTIETPGFDGVIGEATLQGKSNAAQPNLEVYGKNHDVYLGVNYNESSTEVGRVFVFDGTDGHQKCELLGTGAQPNPTFDFGQGVPIAIDQSDGELFVYDLGHEAVDRFALDGEGPEGCPAYSFAGQLPPPTTDPHPLFLGQSVNIEVDAPCRTGPELSESCDFSEYDSPNEGELYATLGRLASNSHLYAFKLRRTAPPEVEEQAAKGVTETGAVLEAQLNPGALQTTYRFEYVTQAEFEASGYANAALAPQPDADAGNASNFATVRASLTGLAPDTAYRFRLVASNCADPEAEPGECRTEGEGVPGGVGADAFFATYPVPPPSSRAYELVTPADTGGHVPTMSMLGDEFSFVGFPTDMASPDGNGLLFGSRSGALPGLGGGGYQDVYEARRDPEEGWRSGFAGLSGAQAQRPHLGGISLDHGYAFWNVRARDPGALIGSGAEGERYLNTPAGTPHSPNCAAPNDPEGRVEWIACGSLGVDPPAEGKWISKDAGHVVFESAAHLEGCAPPAGTNAIYDRTPGGPTRCLSLLPGDVTPTGSASYEGTSADGSTVAFSIGSTLYVRRDGETLEVAAGNPTFGGLSPSGTRLFYTTGGTFGGGDIFAFDTESGEATQVGSGGESTLAYVSPDGSHAYFVSPLQLDGGEGQAAADNLYAWDGTDVSFIAVLDPLDLSGEGVPARGLGWWLNDAVSADFTAERGPANVTARATPDGSAFLFESQAPLAGHQSDGQRQIYRYAEDAPPAQRLLCVSCNPTGAPVGSAAELESPPAASAVDPFPPTSALTEIANVTADGRRAFFQSSERLVSADLDGRQDVYEWRAQGEEGCARVEGCLALISSPRSAADEYLWAVGAGGRDVFFLSSDTLLLSDPDATPSVYDARIGGGFPPPIPPNDPCLGEACQPVVSPPDDPTPASSSFEGAGNVTGSPKRRCPKGKRKVHRASKTRCLPRHGKRGRKRVKRRRDNRRAAR